MAVLNDHLKIEKTEGSRLGRIHELITAFFNITAQKFTEHRLW